MSRNDQSYSLENDEMPNGFLTLLTLGHALVALALAVLTLRQPEGSHFGQGPVAALLSLPWLLPLAWNLIAWILPRWRTAQPLGFATALITGAIALLGVSVGTAELGFRESFESLTLLPSCYALFFTIGCLAFAPWNEREDD